MEANRYSSNWFGYFHLPIQDKRTELETKFISSVAPLPAFSRIGDICCGMGRHSRALSSQGYDVTGIERDPAAVKFSVQAGGGPTYIEADILTYRLESESFDAVVLMGQSFGFGTAHENQAILDSLAKSLRAGGRILLDLWCPSGRLLLIDGIASRYTWVPRNRLTYRGYITLRFPLGGALRGREFCNSNQVGQNPKSWPYLKARQKEPSFGVEETHGPSDKSSFT